MTPFATLRRLGGALLAGTLLAAAALPAQAHKPSDAYLTLEVADAGRVEQRLDIALRDLDRELALDADGDGALTWGELRTRWDEMERLVDAGVAVSAGDAGCQVISRGTPLLAAHVDGQHAVMRRTLQCTGTPGAVTVDYTLFVQSDPTHRGIARVQPAADANGAQGSPMLRVLVPGAGPQTIAPEGADRPQGLAGFFAKGLHHIAIGLDHILFLVTLLMVAVWRKQAGAWVPRDAARSAWREVLHLVTAFTVGHSLTLGLAASGVLAPPSRWVESLIAASVLIAALDNLRPFLPGPRWITVGLFGLVHGFGFAGPLQDLGLGGSELLLPLLAFNLGVEAGQLLVVALLLPVMLKLRATAGYRRWFVRPGSALVALLALFWTVERALAMPLIPFSL